MPKGRPITINIKAMTPEEFRAYKRKNNKRYYIPKGRIKVQDNETERRCIVCETWKPRTWEFFETHHGKLRGECRQCRVQQHKARKYNGT